MKKYRLYLKEILINEENTYDEFIVDEKGVELRTMDNIPKQVLYDNLKKLFDKLIENFFINKGE